VLIAGLHPWWPLEWCIHQKPAGELLSAKRLLADRDIGFSHMLMSLHGLKVRPWPFSCSSFSADDAARKS
jgi:hypothetical protein